MRYPTVLRQDPTPEKLPKSGDYQTTIRDPETGQDYVVCCLPFSAVEEQVNKDVPTMVEAKIIEMYIAGRLMTDIGREIGLYPSKIYRTLEKYGIGKRMKHGRPGR